MHIYIYISIYLFSPAWGVQTLAHFRDKRFRFFRRFYRVLGLAGYCSGCGSRGRDLQNSGNSHESFHRCHCWVWELFPEVTHHMDPVPHVPPEEMGFQHLASEAQQSPAEEEVFMQKSWTTWNISETPTKTKQRKLNMLRDACFAEESLCISHKVSENEYYQTTVGAVPFGLLGVIIFPWCLLLLVWVWVFPKP